MPTYAGFTDIADYINQRCARDKINHSQLSIAIGAQPNYIHGIVNGLFNPSRPRADKIAVRFGDDSHLVRVLAGLEAPPADTDEKTLREIIALATALDAPARREAVRYLNYLLYLQKK